MVDRHHPGKAPTAVLQHLGQSGSCLTIAALAEALGLTHRQISDAAARLLRRQYLERMAAGCYQLTETGFAAAAAGEVITSGPTGPRNKTRQVRDSLRERAWRAMRVRRRFTVPDLVADAAIETDKAPADNLHRYLRALAATGYVVELSRRAAGVAETSNGFKRFMLAKDTGPRAPAVLSKVSGIHDANTGEDVVCPPR